MNIKGIVAGGLLLVSAGCTGHIETRASATGDRLPGQARVAPVQQDARLAEALKAEGFVVDSDAGVLLDLGISDRPASVAIDGQSAARKRHFLQQCPYHIFRVTLSAIDRESGAVIVRAGVEEHHCRAKIDAVAPLLIRRAVVTLRDGAGSGRVSRRGVN